MNHQTLDNFNSDLRLIRSLSAHTATNNRTHPLSVYQLAALLKFKKQQYPPQKQQLQSGREWLIKKGINLDPLVTRVVQLKKQMGRMKIIKQTQNYFHINLNSYTVEDYLEKAEEYANMNLMQSIMKRVSHRKKITDRLLQIVKQQNIVLPGYESQISKQSLNSYIEITKNILKNEREPINISKSMLKQLRIRFMTDDSVWEILHHQLNTYNVGDTIGHNMVRMFISSMQLIQQQFQTNMHGHDFQRYVNHHYLTRVGDNIVSQKHSIWPKIWLAYCSNQPDKVVDLLISDQLQHQDLIHIYKLSNQAIQIGKPIRQSYVPSFDINDIFYQQFIYNITGQPRNSHPFFIRQRSLQLIFIVVSTLGIYYESDRTKLETTRATIINKYCDIGPQKDTIKYILYLLDYSTLIKIGANAMMSKQEYLHFLIVIAGFPDLAGKINLKQYLTKQLVSFILYLINQKRNQYIYYAQLLSDDVQIEQISSIVRSTDTLDSFEWKVLKQQLGDDQFHKIVVATVEKYCLTPGQELKAAQKLVLLCNDYRIANSCLITFFINYYLKQTNYKYSKQQLHKAETLGLDWSYCSNTASISNGIVKEATAYRMLFQLIISIRQITGYIVRRDVLKLREFIGNCPFIVLKLDQSHSVYQCMLKILDNSHGLELYYYFLRQIIKAAQIYTIRTKADKQELNSLKSILVTQIQTIQSLPWLKRQFQSTNLSKLKEQLNSSMMNQNESRI